MMPMNEKPSKSVTLSNKFLLRDMEGITPEMVRKAEIELNETPNNRRESLKELKMLLKAEKDLRPLMDEDFLLRFLRARKYNSRVALKGLKTYYFMKAKYSRVISNVWPSEVKHVFNLNSMTLLPQRDSEGCVVGVANIDRFDFTKVTLNEIVASIIVCMEHVCQSEATQICGIVIVISLRNLTFSDARHWISAKICRAFLPVIQDGLPLRIKAIHFIHEPPFTNFFISVLTKFFSEKMQKRFHFHGKSLGNLHKYVPSDILPEEFGGHQGPMDNTDFINAILAKEGHYTYIIQYGYEGIVTK